MPTKPQTTKITVKVYEQVYDDFIEQLQALPLRRDMFLDLMIERELPHLAIDLAGLRNSEQAKRYISGRLKRLGVSKVGLPKPFSIAIRKSTANALRRLEKKHNFSRDAFLNRLIVLLRGSDDLLELLSLPTQVQDIAAGVDDMPTSPMKTLEVAMWDPLYYIRAACEKRHGCGLYRLDWPSNWDAFSCYLADEQIPNSPASEAASAKLLADLTGTDDRRGPKAVPGVKGQRPPSLKAYKAPKANAAKLTKKAVRP